MRRPQARLDGENITWWAPVKPLPAISTLAVEEQRVNVLVVVTSPHERWRSLATPIGSTPHTVFVPEDAFVVPAGAFSERRGLTVFVVVNGRAQLRSVSLLGDLVGLQSFPSAWLSAIASLSIPAIASSRERA